jgi:DhnA family fructose-bisphosphate aldolase class Ia
MVTSQTVGKTRRLETLFDQSSSRAVIVPFDDSLISGPEGGLRGIGETLSRVVDASPTGVIGFSGFLRINCKALARVPTIVNLTASTALVAHTRKVLITTVEQAVALGSSAVAVHVNISSAYESHMLRQLGITVASCEQLGIPVLAIMYPRREIDGGDDNYDEMRRREPTTYAKLVSHAVRVAVDLGADVIKTQYTGSAESFSHVIECASGVPVIIAGGPLCEEHRALTMAHDSVAAGGSGVSFGRNVFQHADPAGIVQRLKQAVFSIPPRPISGEVAS